MPSVLLQFQLSADSTSGESRIFFRFFKRYRAVTTATSGEDPRIKRGTRFFRGGESRMSGLAALRCRCQRHLPRPLGVDDCGRGVEVADSETLCGIAMAPASEVSHEGETPVSLTGCTPKGSPRFGEKSSCSSLTES